MKSDDLKVPKQANAKRDVVINPQNCIFNDFLLGKFWCSQNVTNKVYPVPISCLYIPIMKLTPVFSIWGVVKNALNAIYRRWKHFKLFVHHQEDCFDEMYYIRRRSLLNCRFDSEGTKLLNAPRIQNYKMRYVYQVWNHPCIYVTWSSTSCSGSSASTFNIGGWSLYLVQNLTLYLCLHVHQMMPNTWRPYSGIIRGFVS